MLAAPSVGQSTDIRAMYGRKGVKNILPFNGKAYLVVVQGRRVTLSVNASLVNNAIDLIGGDADGNGLEGFVQDLATELAGHAEV